MDLGVKGFYLEGYCALGDLELFIGEIFFSRVIGWRVIFVSR